MLVSDTVDLRPELAKHLLKNRSAIRLFAEAEARGEARVLDITSVMCGSGRCELTHGTHPLYFDGGPSGGHLSKFGSIALTAVLERMLARPR